jgi:hypothetical protein
MTKFKGIALSLAAMLVTSPAQAIDIDGSNPHAGVQALWIFKNFSGGVIPDSSGVAPLIPLTVDKPGNVGLFTDRDGNTGLRINIAAAIKSTGPASKINSACGASNAMTVDVWVRNLSEEPVDRPQPVRILTLARKEGTTHVNNFMLGQRYDNAGFYQFDLNASTEASFQTEDQKGFLMFGSTMPAQRVVFTKDANGVARLWRTNAAGLLEKVQERAGVGSIAGWATDANRDNLRISIGNEPNYADFPEYNGSTVHPEWKVWLGTVYAIAIYCRALTQMDLLGASAPGSDKLPAYPVDPSDTITDARRKAHLIYKRITGTNTPIDNPAVKEMEALVAQGTQAGLIQAAMRATQENQFYNITVRDMAARMTTRDNTVNTPLNDMVATIVGVVRDNGDARELLTGNFSYRADPTLAAVPVDEKLDFLLSNRHYEAIEAGRYDLARVLRRVNGQKLYNGATDSIVLNPDAAGVITSRAFLSAHASAGTNRRLVEFTFKEFLCIPLNQWADVAGSDTYVGRDVDRAPGNEHSKYKTQCRTCHSVMDSIRGAFAKVDFSSNYVKHADVMYGLTSQNEAGNDNPVVMYQSPLGIAGKMNRNADTFPAGNPVTDNFWENNAGRGLNAEYFGWPAVPAGQTTHKGNGIKSLATLISQSKAFPRCMALRAYRSVCKRDALPGEKDALYAIADEYNSKAVNVREIFARVAVTPQCLGQ